LAVQGKEPFILDRSEAYMGVMVDDLVTRGVTEPYRMFTSRAEYRLLLREDNAGERLMRKGEALGLVPSALVAELEKRLSDVSEQLKLLEGVRVKPDETVNQLLRDRGGSEIRDALTAAKLLKRPEITAQDLVALGLLDAGLEPAVYEQMEIRLKYEGYIDRQKHEAGQFQKMERVAIPDDLDYSAVEGLSRELRERLNSIRPRSLGQVSRIPGVTPAALGALMVRLRSG